MDAPQHADSEGEVVDNLPLSPFLGPADVVNVAEDDIQPRHVPENPAPRVLFKTGCSSLERGEWPTEVTPLLKATVRSLSALDVTLAGTDAPSVDPLESSQLSAHHALIDEGIINLEGLRLSDVPAGRYILVALPLKIVGGDAAPVRAALSTTPIEME